VVEPVQHSQELHQVDLVEAVLEVDQDLVQRE
jgi:hypothetical protein